MKTCAILLLLCITFTRNLHAIQLIEPDDIFAPHELEDILEKKNFFHYQDIDDETPIWVGTYRKYSHHLLGPRTHMFDMKDVTHKVLTDGFPIQYALEDLYRSRMGIHSQIGNIIPKFTLNFADTAQMGLSTVFANVFSFILPGNWMKLANQALIYKTTKLILVKTVLDQMLEVKNAYLDVHEMIIDYEILNYYYVHLQVLVNRYPQNSHQVLTVLGYLGILGNAIANKRARLKLGFDILAKVMAFEKFDNLYTAGTLNIKEIENFPKHLHELDTHEDHIKDKEAFIQEVVKRSLELQIVSKFYTISKLNVGVTAAGGSLNVNPLTGTEFKDSRFALSVGYDNLPNILISKSYSRTAKLDVQSGYIDILTTARILLDAYSNALSKYAEAKQALVLNRESLKAHLDHILKNNLVPDASFILVVSQLVSSELTINAVLHAMFRAKAGISRYLLKDKENALQYLPSKGAILEELSKIKGENMADIYTEEEVDRVFRNLRDAKKLEKILYHYPSLNLFKKYSEDEMKSIVQRNIGNLLFSKLSFYKERKFYKILEAYIQEKQINITPMESFILSEKKTLAIKRFFQRKKNKYEGSYLHNFDFEHFGEKPQNQTKKKTSKVPESPELF